MQHAYAHNDTSVIWSDRYWIMESTSFVHYISDVTSAEAWDGSGWNCRDSSPCKCRYFTLILRDARNYRSNQELLRTTISWRRPSLSIWHIVTVLAFLSAAWQRRVGDQFSQAQYAEVCQIYPISSKLAESFSVQVRYKNYCERNRTRSSPILQR